MSPQCLYSPKPLVHIKLEGPREGLGRPQVTSRETQATHLVGKASGKRLISSQYGRTLSRSGSEAAQSKVYYKGSYKPLRRRRKAPGQSSPESHHRNWDGAGPFYLSLISQDHSGTNTGLNHKTMSATASCGNSGSSNNNNRLRSVMSGRKLQQLISISSMTSDSDEDEDKETAEKKMKASGARSSSAATAAPKLERRRSDPSPNRRAFLDSLEERHMNLAMAKLHISESDNMTLCNNSMEYNPPSITHTTTTVHTSERSDRERWACHRAAMSRVPPHLCKVKAKSSACLAVQRSPFFDQTESPHKVSTSQHSCVWDAILRRRNPRHQQTTSETQRARPTKSLVKAAVKRTFDHEPLGARAMPETECAVGAWAVKRKEKVGDDSANATGRMRRLKWTHSGLDRTRSSGSEEVGPSPQHSSRFLASDESHHEDSESITVKPFRHLDLDARKYGTPGRGYENFQGRKRSPPQETPPEVIYPPYSQNKRSETEKKGRSKISAQEHQLHKKRANHSRANKIICGFWQSLVEDDRAISGDDHGKMKRNKSVSAVGEEDCTTETRLARTRSEEPFATATPALAHDEVNHTEVAPGEIIRSCQVKGYEILRRLNRGKFRENISLYLANNESNPKFSPVEIVVVTLPSRSFARSFLEASFSDNSAAKRRQGFAHRQAPSQLLTAHRNLLTRLHVFTVGNCVYQVSNYCSWPTLASLLQPSPPDTPTTARSLCSSPIRGCHFHNATPEPPQSHLSSRHACASPDATRPALQAWKRAGFRCCDGYSNCGGECSSRAGWRLSGRSSPNLPGPVKLEESATRIIFRQICEGLRHLHDHGLLHSDLNCSNVLVTDKLQVKLAGYGPCCLHTPWESSPGESCDPPLADPYDVYIPPEIMARRSYRGWAKSSDIWCLGMTLLHMTLGEVSQQVNCAVRLRRSKQFKTLCLEHVGYQLGLLLEHLLQVRPVDRPCVDTVLEHAWFSDGTDLASEIDRLTQQVNMRTDGRTFPLPKRIRQAFPATPAGPDGELTWAEGGAKPEFLSAHDWQLSCHERQDRAPVGGGAGDNLNDADDEEEEEEEEVNDHNDCCGVYDSRGEEEIHAHGGGSKTEDTLCKGGQEKVYGQGGCGQMKDTLFRGEEEEVYGQGTYYQIEDTVCRRDQEKVYGQGGICEIEGTLRRRDAACLDIQHCQHTPQEWPESAEAERDASTLCDVNDLESEDGQSQSSMNPEFGSYV